MFTVKARIKNLLAAPKALAAARKARVKVGFPAGESDAGNIQKAVWNEFGTRGGASGGGWGGPIPERPFMRNAMRDNDAKYRASMTSAGRAILWSTATGGDTASEIRKTLRKLGIMAQGDIQAEITALSSPPNSPVTIALKGSSNPLIDSGQMRAAVTWKIDE